MNLLYSTFSCRSRRLLIGAILSSLLLHLLLVFGWGWAPLWLRTLPTSGVQQAMQVVVLAPPAMPPAPIVQAPVPVPVPAASKPPLLKPPVKTRATPVLSIEKAVNPPDLTLIRTPVPALTPIQEPAAVSAASASDSARAAPATAGDGVSADSLRQYRIDLAGAARRFRHYPAAARSRGSEGVAEIVISVSAGVPVPSVKLQRTSGHALLDEQAVEMLTRAVSATPLPESLRGRSFLIPMPIRFSLEE